MIKENAARRQTDRERERERERKRALPVRCDAIDRWINRARERFVIYLYVGLFGFNGPREKTLLKP